MQRRILVDWPLVKRYELPAGSGGLQLSWERSRCSGWSVPPPRWFGRESAVCAAGPCCSLEEQRSGPSSCSMYMRQH